MRVSCLLVVGALSVVLVARGQTAAPVAPVAPAPQQAVGGNPSADDLFKAFQVPGPTEAKSLDDLIRHFQASDVPCAFIRHDITDQLRADHILEQAHSTTGGYSFTINRLASRSAAESSLAEIHGYGHEGAMNGTFALCIHIGFPGHKVISVFRQFEPARPAASGDATNHPTANP